MLNAATHSIEPLAESTDVKVTDKEDSSACQLPPPTEIQYELIHILVSDFGSILVLEFQAHSYILMNSNDMFAIYTNE